MKTIITRSAQLALTLCLLAACEGPTGPQGPQGDTGPQGVQGEPGASSNVTILSFVLNDADFVNGTSVEAWSRPTPEITQAVVDHGYVMLFSVGGGTATPLPFVLPTSSATANLTFRYSVGTLVMQIIRSSGGPVAAAFDGMEIRAAIVTGATKVDVRAMIERSFTETPIANISRDR